MSNNPIIQKIKHQFSDDIEGFGIAFVAPHFTDESPPFHKTIMKALINFDKVAIAAPRGFSKSTIVSFLYVLFCIVFIRKRHIIILQNTMAKSCGTLNTVKEEIKNNPLLQLFGITIEKDAQDDTIFVHADGSKTRVLCKGHEQMGSVRGEKFMQYRPDLIVVDDLEDDEMVKNPERRRELQEVFNDAIDPAIDPKTGQIVFIGTVLHDDALIAKMIDPDQYRKYRKFKFKAANEDRTESLWSDRFPINRLKEIEAENPAKFAKEYQNDPVSGINTHFDKEDFRYWTMTNDKVTLFNKDGSVLNTYVLTDCIASVGCDLAWEEKRSADFTALIPALLTPNNEYLFDEYFCKRGVRPDELIEVIFSMKRKYEQMTGSNVYFGFEKAKHEKIVKWMLDKEMRKRNDYIIMKDIKWDKDKVTRMVTKLQPLYHNHVVFHRRNYGEFEHQLLRIPSGTHDDLPDAAQIVVQLLTNPKSKSKDEVVDTHFDWLMKQVKNKRNRQRYIFGQKSNYTFPFKTHKSFH